MARDSYNQSIGNPLQSDRLPNSWPTIEVPCRPSGGLEAIAVILCWGVFMFASSMLAWLVIRREHSLPAPPFLVVGIVVGAIVFLMGGTPNQQSGEHGLFLRFTARLEEILSRICMGITLVSALFAITVFRELPSIIQQLLASIALGSLIRAFGRHYAGFCTTSPQRRQKAWDVRRDCDWALRGIAIWPTIAICLGNAYGVFWDVATVTVIIVAIATAILASSRPTDAFTAPWEALVQWCTYNLRNVRVPGLYIGPAGPWLRRLSLTAVCCFLVTACVAPSVWRTVDNVATVLDSTNILRNGRPDSESVFSMILAVPVVVTLGAPILLCWPVLVYASIRGTRGRTPGTWNNLVADLRSSPDSIERESIFAASVLADGSPVLIPRSVFKHHAHFLGDSGSGKTSLGLAPFLEQMIAFGDCSFVVLDLKGDSLEILASMNTAVEEVRKCTGKQLPLKHFTIQPDRSTFAFNPLTQPYWKDLESFVQADILCAAFGLNYGTEYGASWYTAANADVCHRTILAAPEATSFRQLSEALDKLLAAKGANKMDADIQKAGLHIQLVLKRLAEVEALNVDSSHAQAENASRAIVLAELFQRPELLYFQLPSMLMPSMAPEIARIVIYSLLSAATMTRDRHCQVYLVVDEFQRIVSDNLESILQLARSMNVGVILANQSMQDLQTRTTDLIPAVESNCRFRQWYAVSCSDDRTRVVSNSGETLENFESSTVSDTGSSLTVSPKLSPRLSQNDVILASDHAKHSIICLKNGAGYAQYGGLPFLVESDYHITADEYESRQRMSWPEAENGAFVPRSRRAKTPLNIPVSPPPGPIVTTEYFSRLFNQDDDDAMPPGRVGKPPRPGNGPRKPPTAKKGKKS